MSNEMDAMVKALLGTPQGAAVLSNMDKIKEFLNKPEGRQIVQMLSGKGGEAVKQAAGVAADGNPDQAKRMLAGVLSTPEGAQLAKTIMDLLK